MDVGRLIECVRKHVFLYDTFHKEYSNVNLKNAVWEYIGKELNETGEACKLRWKTVRDGYTKYKKQVAAGKPVMAYIWNDKLKFLDYYNVNRNMKTRKMPEQIQDESIAATFGSLVNLPDSNSSAFFQPDKLRSEVEDPDGFKAYINTLKTKDLDAIDHLFLSYAETFKSFSQKQQIFLKIKLAKLFACAELERLKMETDKSFAPVPSKTPKRQGRRRKETANYNIALSPIEDISDGTVKLDVERIDNFEDIDIEVNQADKELEIYASIKSEKTEESKTDQVESEDENAVDSVSPVKTEYTEPWAMESEVECQDDDDDDEPVINLKPTKVPRVGESSST